MYKREWAGAYKHYNDWECTKGNAHWRIMYHNGLYIAPNVHSGMRGQTGGMYIRQWFAQNPLDILSHFVNVQKALRIAA